jgi:hypothetical protein
MLNIARQIKSAWNSKSTKIQNLYEVEIVPLGDSANEKRKLDRITTRFSDLCEHENVPLPGFTLLESNRKNWGSTDPTWLVIDPRGFLARISGDNLEQILHVTGITEGLIQEKCVWARDDSQTTMKLIPVSAKEYREAVDNTELLENKISLKDVNIGDTVLLQNGLIGRYFGTVSLYGPLNNYPSTGEYKATTKLRRQIIEVKPTKYHYQTDLKILKVISSTGDLMTREDAVKIMNTSIETSFFTTGTDMSRSSTGMYDQIRHTSVHATRLVDMIFEEVTKEEAGELFDKSELLTDSGVLILEAKSGEKYMVDFPYFRGSTPTSKTNFGVIRVRMNKDNNGIITLDDRSYGRSSKAFELDNFVKFYKIVKCVKNDSYI